MLEAAPWDMRLADVPTITNARVREFGRIALERGLIDKAGVYLDNGADAPSGLARPFLTAFSNNIGTDPVEVAAAMLSEATPGERHYSLLGAIAALVRRGYSDCQVERLRPVFEVVLGRAAEVRPANEFDNALSWARRKIMGGYDAKTLAAKLGADRWKRM